MHTREVGFDFRKWFCGFRWLGAEVSLNRRRDEPRFEVRVLWVPIPYLNVSELLANRQRNSRKDFISIQLGRGCGFQTFPFTKDFSVPEKRIFNVIFI
jgi:hypothetical protein